MKLWAQIEKPAESSSTPLVLLHAFPMDSRMWRGQVAHFSWARTVVAPDARGYGHSKMPDGAPFTMRAYADDVADTLDSLGVDKAVFGGCSMGGYAIFELWNWHRDRVAGMILCDTRAEPDAAAARENRQRQVERIEREGAAFMVDFAAENLLGDHTRQSNPQLVAEVRQWVSEAPATTIAANLEGLAARADSGPRLPTINVPTLVIVGEQDKVTPLEAAQHLVNEIQGARLAVIPNAGHLAPLENPESVNQAIGGFL